MFKIQSQLVSDSKQPFNNYLFVKILNKNHAIKYSKTFYI